MQSERHGSRRETAAIDQPTRRGSSERLTFCSTGSPSDRSRKSRSIGTNIYGLSVASEIDLPEMWPIAPEDARQPDVEIRRGQAPLELEETSKRTGEFVVTDAGILLDLPEIGRFWAVGDHTLIATPAPDADANLIRLFLLGSGLAVILHQRGEFPLHASAIEHDGKCFAFLGESGSGKSTLVGMLAQRGFPIVSDDVLVLSTPQPEAGAVMTVPGIPVLKLWPESAGIGF